MYLTVLAGRAVEKTSEENQVQFRTLLIRGWMWTGSLWPLAEPRRWRLPDETSPVEKSDYFTSRMLYSTCLVAPRGCRGNVRTLQLNLEKGTCEYNSKPRFSCFIRSDWFSVEFVWCLFQITIWFDFFLSIESEIHKITYGLESSLTTCSST